MKTTRKIAEVGVLFLHHNVTPVVLNNLQSIKTHNPEAPIETISAGMTLPGGYSLSATPELFRRHQAHPQLSSDILVCSWHKQRKLNCKKWWIVEWDTHCTMPIKDYYKPVWDYSFVAAAVYLRRREKDWLWFRHAKNFSTEYRGNATGAVPFLYLLSNEAIKTVCECLLDTSLDVGNSELRFATAATKCGFPPCGFSPPGDQISWFEPKKRIIKTGIYHPVKHLV